MSKEETLESKLVDLQSHHEKWMQQKPTNEKEKALREKVIAGLEADIDLVQKQIQAKQG